MNNTDNINLEYGQKVMFPTYPLIHTPFGFGIQSVSSKDKPVLVEMEIKKYWDSDTDANKYKVALHPVKKETNFGIEKLYSLDLKSLIKEGTVTLVK